MDMDDGREAMNEVSYGDERCNAVAVAVVVRRIMSLATDGLHRPHTRDGRSRRPDSLRIGERGPTALEDFHFREKSFHFDHERIPERVVHGRGYGARGFFEDYEPLTDPTAADCSSGPLSARPRSCGSRRSTAPGPATSRATYVASRSRSTRRTAGPVGDWGHQPRRPAPHGRPRRTRDRRLRRHLHGRGAPRLPHRHHRRRPVPAPHDQRGPPHRHRRSAAAPDRSPLATPPHVEPRGPQGPRPPPHPARPPRFSRWPSVFVPACRPAFPDR